MTKFNLEFEIDYYSWEWGYHKLLPTLADCKSHYFAIGCIFIYWTW